MRIETCYGFPTWKAEHWLGHRVKFQLAGQRFEGEVTESQRHYSANGIHDILTVEIWDGNSLVKIQAHRQKFTRI